MPRLQPIPGYLTATDVKKTLNINDGQLYHYVEKGWLKRYGPPERKHKFYKQSEVEALLQSRYVFDEYQEKLATDFEVASPLDIATIVDIDKRTFHVEITEETYMRWLRKNPETFFVLRDITGKVVGYACILPLQQEVMNQFIRDEIDMDDISPDDVALFEPGIPLHLYVIALCIDPMYKSPIKQEYGAALVRKLFGFILELGERGVEIETITARTYKPDGLRLLRKMGMPQLRSPVEGKHLFSVHVVESGFPMLVRYSDLLAQWKAGHELKEE